MCRDIKAVRADLLIAVDHEGGRVQRFRTDGFTHLPPMSALGALWGEPERRGEMPGASVLRATNAAVATGYVLGSELRACGVDMSFTPVLDLNHGDSAVIGDRSFGRDPRTVALLAQSLMHCLALSGMGNCGTCLVDVVEGADLLSEQTEAELKKVKAGKLKEGWRMSCQCLVGGDEARRVRRSAWWCDPRSRRAPRPNRRTRVDW